ncbi:hypothetical protein [Pseudoalteromonas sp. 31A1]|uniref:lipopolysaccharide biosynthesis protein n=1 Tax=Pseudoalteromonas sp. 31A1 TaxID=2686351 RepID=UPI0013FDE5DB|nr:hypothetical protein [Pseudoalteromonas sp. 31A1]
MSLFKGASTVVIASAISQLISISLFPILLYFYSPENIGVLGVFTSLVSIVAGVSSLRIERKVFLNGSEFGVIQSIVNKTVPIIAIVICILIAFLMFFKYVTLDLCFLPLIFIGGIFSCYITVNTVFQSYLISYKIISLASIFRVIIVFVFQISFFFIIDGDYAVVIGSIGGMVITYLYLKVKPISTGTKISILNYFRNASNRHEAIAGGVQALGSTVSNALPIILISSFIGVKEAGIFFLAEKVIRAPINVVSNNLRSIIASEYKKRNDIKLIYKSSIILFILSLFIFLLGYTFIDYFNDNIVNTKWEEALVVIKIYLLFIVLNFTTLSYQSYNMHFIEMVKVAKLDVFSLFIKIILIFISVFLVGDLNTIVYAILLSGLITFFLHIALFNTRCKK